MKSIFILFLLSFTLKGFSCGNEHYSTMTQIPLKNGLLDLSKLITTQHSESSIDLPYWHYNFKDGLQQNAEDLYTNYLKLKDYKYLSDYTWAKIKLGNAKEMIPILDSLLKKHPNDYNILANLGTAYELVGNNKKALELITKAVIVNPSSHFNSEWIHIQILNHKINNNESDDYYGDVLGLSEDAKIYYKGKNELILKTQNEIDSLMFAIAYQLHERMFFIKNPNKIIGHLLFDFANLVKQRYGFKESLIFYNEAVSFNANLSWKVQKIINNEATNFINKSEVASAPIKSEYRNPLLFALFFVFGILSTLIGIKIKKIKAQSESI